MRIIHGACVKYNIFDDEKKTMTIRVQCMCGCVFSGSTIEEAEKRIEEHIRRKTQ